MISLPDDVLANYFFSTLSTDDGPLLVADDFKDLVELSAQIKNFDQHVETTVKAYLAEKGVNCLCSAEKILIEILTVINYLKFRLKNQSCSETLNEILPAVYFEYLTYSIFNYDLPIRKYVEENYTVHSNLILDSPSNPKKEFIDGQINKIRYRLKNFEKDNKNRILQIKAEEADFKNIRGNYWYDTGRSSKKHTRKYDIIKLYAADLCYENYYQLLKMLRVNKKPSKTLKEIKKYSELYDFSKKLSDDSFKDYTYKDKVLASLSLRESEITYRFVFYLKLANYMQMKKTEETEKIPSAITDFLGRMGRIEINNLLQSIGPGLSKDISNYDFIIKNSFKHPDFYETVLHKRAITEIAYTYTYIILHDRKHKPFHEEDYKFIYDYMLQNDYYKEFNDIEEIWKNTDSKTELVNRIKNLYKSDLISQKDLEKMRNVFTSKSK